jgi:hypothetical protein
VAARGSSALLLACTALAIPALAGCGSGDDVDVGPAAAVPESTPVYVEATVRPEGEAKAGAEAALGKILDTNDPGAKLISLIERETTPHLKPGEQFTFDEDIDLWLGERVGVFFSSFEDDSDGILVIESKDNEAALNAFREDDRVTGQTGEYDGHTYEFQTEEGGGTTVFGPVGDFIVVGPEEGFKQAVDASEGGNLRDSDEFKDSIADLPDDSLGILYSVPRDFLEAIPDEEVDPIGRSVLEKAAGDSLDEPVVGDLTASAEEIELDVTAAGGGDPDQSSLLDAVPAQSWLALSTGDLGKTAKQLIDRLEESGIPGFEENLSQVEDVTGASLDELTGALGDSALYVQGVTEEKLSGALIIQSNDTELTGRLLTQLQGLLSAGGGAQFKELTLPGGGSGFSFFDPTEAPQPIEVAQQADKIVIGYGSGSTQQALGGEGASDGQLSTTPAFAAAAEKLSSLGLDAFLSFPPLFQLAESEGAARDPGYVEAKPYIDALDYLALGAGSDDDRAELRFVIGLK